MKIKRTSWHYKMVSWFDKRSNIDTDSVNNLEYQMRICIGIVVAFWGIACAFAAGVLFVCGVVLAALVAAAPLLHALGWLPVSLNLVPVVWLLSPPFWAAVLVSLAVYLLFKVFLKLVLIIPVKLSGRVVIGSKWLDKVEFED